MNVFTKNILILGLTFFAVPAAFSAETAKTEQNLPNPAKATEFFGQELNFKTNPYGVNNLIKDKATNVVIVDVRDAKSFAKGHIPGAINVPYNKFNGFEGSETEFPGLQKDKINIVYCYELLCNLGQKAAKKFASIGYPVKEMSGGFSEWKKHKYPVAK
ncbi:MAG: rhodanese-like domain-containing protein [Alphaproteobacteria bacterium]|nr:rhodanese-like domain-containing protein [Alphaproteobacteria bacterium]